MLIGHEISGVLIIHAVQLLFGMAFVYAFVEPIKSYISGYLILHIVQFLFGMAFVYSFVEPIKSGKVIEFLKGLGIAV